MPETVQNAKRSDRWKVSPTQITLKIELRVICARSLPLESHAPMNIKKIISDYEAEFEARQRQPIIEAFKAVILAERPLRANKFSYAACRPDPSTPEGKEYHDLTEAYALAYSHLWRVTDFEYDQNGFSDIIWTWRYWKVEARKCCWYQKKLLTTWRAGWTMRKLHEAEWNFVQVCGLQNIYKSSCQYLEEAFPNLKCN